MSDDDKDLSGADPKPEAEGGRLDKPSRPAEDTATDEWRGKDIRGPEGHAKD